MRDGESAETSSSGSHDASLVTTMLESSAPIGKLRPRTDSAQSGSH